MSDARDVPWDRVAEDVVAALNKIGDGLNSKTVYADDRYDQRATMVDVVQRVAEGLELIAVELRRANDG